MAEDKIQELTQWLHDHPVHPDRLKVLSDLRALQVARSTGEQKLENISQGLPTLGLELPPKHDTNEKPRSRTDQ